jgi:hypothetical protein
VDTLAERRNRQREFLTAIDANQAVGDSVQPLKFKSDQKNKPEGQHDALWLRTNPMSILINRQDSFCREVVDSALLNINQK